MKGILSFAAVCCSIPQMVGGSGFMRRSQVVEAKGSLMAAQLPMNAPSDILVVNLVPVDFHTGEVYMGHIWVGQPAQKMSVLFHTSSGHILLPHEACEDKACVEHTRYSPFASTSAMDVQLDGQLVTAGHRYAHGNVKRQVVLLDYSDSERGQGEVSSLIVRDHICLDTVKGDKGCVDMEVLAATTMPDHPFLHKPNDGIVGLGLESLAANPLCSFFGRFVQGSNLLPQFGISYGPTDGQILFGGHDDTLFISPLRWLPVVKPGDGFWQVEIRSIRVGSTVIDSCEKGCSAVVDSGAAKMGVKDSMLEQFKDKLQSHIVVGDGCTGPELIFDMGDFTLALPPDDYTDRECVPELGPLHMEASKLEGVYAFGAPLLRHYYAAFDWEKKSVGFARSTKAARPKLPFATSQGLRR